MPDKGKGSKRSRRREPLVSQRLTAADRPAVAPMELPLSERENGYHQMIVVVRVLVVIAAYMMLPNEQVWVAGRLIAKERRQIALLFNFKASGSTELT
ncbi:hypothetical protein [Bradyrhizobium sp. Leo170]|uniref:hypothetical protein n=1 Tax=Bradyrhizobium sp. Leo170 TaxID=1571199 RepID=UPI00102E4B05|nr:hypothetical protein [Bradyrhizobium sp. Leo170]